jgi:parvulin-like peptidyl-prolyl isomerase
MRRGKLVVVGLCGVLIGFGVGLASSCWTSNPGEAKPAANLQAWVGKPPVIQFDHDAVLLARVGEGGVTARQFIDAASHRVAVADGSLPMEERLAILNELVRSEALWQVAAEKLLYADDKVRQIMVNLLIRDEVHTEVRRTDYDEPILQGYFDAHPEDFLVPAKVQVSRIFVAVGEGDDEADTRRRVARLHAQVQDHPERFAAVAQEHSEDGYRRRGGDLGYVSSKGKPGVPPDVIERAFTMEEGEISDPFLAGGGFNILHVVTLREEKVRTFDQMKGSVIRKVKHERVTELTEALVASVLESRSIEIDEPALAGLDLTSRVGAAGVPLDLNETKEAAP